MPPGKKANKPLEVVGPIGGCSNGAPFSKNPARFCPPRAIQNTRIVGSSSGRLRFSQRPGMSRFFSGRMGVGGWDLSGVGSPVQAFDVLQAATGTVGFTRGSPTGLTSITSLSGGPATGTVWIINGATTAMLDSITNTDTPVADQTFLGAFQVGWHAANPHLLAWVNLCVDTTAGNQIYASVHVYNAQTRTQLWQTYLKDWDATTPATQAGGAVGANSIIPNSVRVYADYTFVSCGQYVYVFRTSDGFYLKRVTPSGWADEVQDVRRSPLGGLFALFTGSSSVSGIIPANTALVHEGQHVRAGVALFQINADTGNAAPAPLTHVAFGQTLTDTGNANYENHQTFRFSEHLFRGYDPALGALRTNPRGGLPFGFALDASGNIFCSFTNRGWGKTLAADIPDSSFAPTTVCKIGGITATFGRLQWEGDTQSVLDQYVTPGGVTCYNDIPGGGALNRQWPNGLASLNGPGGDEPSIDSLCCDAAGDVYAGGHRNQLDVAGGFNVFKMSGLDGTLVWGTNLSGMVYQHCMAVDPTDGNVVVGGERNSDWDGSNADGTGPKQAHLWKLSAATGAVLWHQDLGAVRSCFGVDISSEGKVAYCTPPIT
jgi:hypothetical protein